MRKIFSGDFKGQIIVLFAVVLVALLGFTALAVDGSMIYSDRRAAQNAADSSALAGGGVAAQYFENHLVRYDNFSCTNTDVVNGMNQAVTYAISRAATNNYTIENNLTNSNGVQVNCNVVNVGPYKDQYIDIKVMVTAPTTTSFAQLFYSGAIKNTVSAVVRVHPRTNLGFGYAVASMGTDCSSGGITAVGNASIVTTHGGLFSNSCISFTGNVNVDVNDPIGNGIRYVTSYSKTGNITVDPTPVQSPVTLVPYVIPAPDCGSVPNQGNVSLSGNNNATINPGRYGSINLAGNSNLILNPGLYCISNGLSLSGNQSVKGTGVTLYFTGGGFSGTGNSDIELTAPTNDAPPAIRGLLMYAAFTNTSDFDVTGNSSTIYQGTIYVPNGSVSAVGNSGMAAVKSQLVGKKVAITGNATIGMDFEGALNYQIPATLDLQQ